MGYPLEGNLFPLSSKRELLSTAVTQGTIQVTHSGSPILLMADSQTTGGYPRIAQVAAVDLPLCAQLRPGEIFTLKEISVEEAEACYLAQQEDLATLKETIAGKFR